MMDVHRMTRMLVEMMMMLLSFARLLFTNPRGAGRDMQWVYIPQLEDSGHFYWEIQKYYVRKLETN